MNEQIVFKPLRDSTDDIKDFNTIDFENTPNIDLNINNNIKLTTTDSEINLDTIPKEDREYNTLKEPVMATLKRDIMSILNKVKYVLNPYLNDDDKLKQLRNWDLWGPLVLTILLAITLAINNNDKGTLFVEVFSIFWLGGIVVTFNAQLLGARVSLFQILCLLGYCMFPLNVSAFIFKVVMEFNIIVKIILVLLACLWACLSAIGFIKSLIIEEKKILVIYPVILFYLFISFFVLMNHKVEV